MEPFSDIGFAKLDMSRARRTGFGETIYCPGKTAGQLVSILETFARERIPVLGTKCSGEQAAVLSEHRIEVAFDPVSGILTSGWARPPAIGGLVALCTAGTADLPVAEEAARTIEFFGGKVERHFDVGVACLPRLLSKIEAIRAADVVIAVAGMEGALGSVVAGLVPAPVIAVPTSVGYGASFQGVAPLLSMLNSCAEGLSVVNIDNGFGAAVSACRMIRKIGKGEA